MERNFYGTVRGFSQASKAWYARAALNNPEEVNDVVTIGFYHPDGSTPGEFEIVWQRLTPSGFVPRLKAFDDSWQALSRCTDIIERIAEHDGENISADKLCEILRGMGLADLTELDRKRVRT